MGLRLIKPELILIQVGVSVQQFKEKCIEGNGAFR